MSNNVVYEYLLDFDIRIMATTYVPGR